MTNIHTLFKASSPERLCVVAHTCLGQIRECLTVGEKAGIGLGGAMESSYGAMERALAFQCGPRFDSDQLLYSAFGLSLFQLSPCFKGVSLGSLVFFVFLLNSQHFQTPIDPRENQLELI